MNNQWKFAYLRFVFTVRALGESSIFIGIQKKVVSPSLGLYTINFNHPCTTILWISYDYICLEDNLTPCGIAVKNSFETSTLDHHDVPEISQRSLNTMTPDNFFVNCVLPQINDIF